VRPACPRLSAPAAGSRRGCRPANCGSALGSGQTARSQPDPAAKRRAGSSRARPRGTLLRSPRSAGYCCVPRAAATTCTRRGAGSAAARASWRGGEPHLLLPRHRPSATTTVAGGGQCKRTYHTHVPLGGVESCGATREFDRGIACRCPVEPACLLFCQGNARCHADGLDQSLASSPNCLPSDDASSLKAVSWPSVGVTSTGGGELGAAQQIRRTQRAIITRDIDEDTVALQLDRQQAPLDTGMEWKRTRRDG
jgi:hypothetical protein